MVFESSAWKVRCGSGVKMMFSFQKLVDGAAATAVDAMLLFFSLTQLGSIWWVRGEQPSESIFKRKGLFVSASIAHMEAENIHSLAHLYASFWEFCYLCAMLSFVMLSLPESLYCHMVMNYCD
jgi:hypothetical protein